MSNINNQDLLYVINNWNTTHDLELSFNSLTNIDISSNDISFNNLTGDFKNTLDNSLSNIDSSINNIIDRLINDFYTNNEIDNSFGAIYDKYNDLYDISYIDNSFTNINNNINDISICEKIEIETSFNTVNDRLHEIDSSFLNVNTKLNTIDTSIRNILHYDISFYGEKTFDSDITITKNLKTSSDFIIILSNGGNVTISGDLQVDGIETTIKSNTVDISDKTILLASNSSSLSQADGAGIKIYNKSDDNPSILYNDNSGCWKTNIGLDISGKITVKDNDFSMKVTNNSNKKLDISMSNGHYVSINGNLNVTGDISNNIFTNISNLNTIYQNTFINNNISVNDISSSTISTHNVTSNSINSKNLYFNDLHSRPKHVTTYNEYIDISVGDIFTYNDSSGIKLAYKIPNN